MSAVWPQPLPFGPWLLSQRLALSAMSDVWLGHREGEEKPCAIKRMLPMRRDDAELRALFAREIAVMQRFRHEGLPQLLESGEAQGVPWLAMPFYPGVSLQALLADGPLPENAALWLATELAAILAVVHAAGLVHADISPDNVHIGAEGRVMLLDFGIAVARGQLGPIHRGKSRYASPEQVAGLPLTEQTDWFAFAKLLTELGLAAAVVPTDVAGSLRAQVADGGLAQAELQRRVVRLQPDTRQALWQAAELRGEAVTDPGVDAGATILRD